MIQDIFPHKFYNEYRPASRAQDDSPVLCFDGKKVLTKIVTVEEEASALQEGIFALQEGSTAKKELLAAQEGSTAKKEVLAAQEGSTAKKESLAAQGDGNLPEGPSHKEEQLIFPTRKELALEPEQLLYAFAVDEEEYFLAHPGLVPEANGYSYMDIRQVRLSVSNVFGMIAFTGYHLYQWYEDCAYCGRCGRKLRHAEHERAMHCDACDINFYPRIMPAVIVGVINGDRLLVTKYSTGFKLYALIAGFAEIGETLEETVAREVLEETGLKVKNIRYYASQPWGLANDMLTGFYCDLDGSDEVHIDETELKLAEWKTREELELHPDSYSLTNDMMRRFKEGTI